MPASTINTYVLIACLVVLAGCTRTDKTTVQAPTNDGQWTRPAHFPEPVYTFGANVYSKAGFDLGKKLFHDPLLSVNNTISCASCHKQENAFADGGIAFSKGIYGKTGTRHSPAIFNMAWNTSFMWDGGVNHIEVMPLAPLINPVEMGEQIANIVHKLNMDATYPPLFQQAFNRDTIDDQQMFWALAQYLSSLISANAKYDRYITGKEAFTDEELKGLTLFRAHCETCHKEPLFTNYSFENNGLDSLFTDVGRFRISQDSADLGKFKVPTLRNIAVTYPYMHDGRFKTLEDVILHYSAGIVASATVSPLLVKNGSGGLKLTQQEQMQLIAFLRTLTDNEFLQNPAFQ